LEKIQMVSIGGIDHVGIRVSDAERALAFYRHFGFEPTYWDDIEPVVILNHGSGAVIHLIYNADARAGGPNVLMDEPEKYPGCTHVALGVASAEQAAAELAEAGIGLSGGPVKLGDGISLFVRDPDRNVVELRQSPA
jgi:lactoylglutathione lyase